MASLKNITNHSKIKTLTKAILITVGLGTVLSMALLAPNALQILKPFLGKGNRKDHERKRIRQAITALHRRRLVYYFEKDGKSYLQVTEKGRVYLRQFQIENMILPQRVWDKKWRVIFFDIPEKKGGSRRAFQRQLKELGCMYLQKSVLIYPHPCRDEMDTLISFWKIRPFVHYFETNDLGRAEGTARIFFNLI